MKSYLNLYPKVCAWDNLFLAYRKARKGKRGRLPAATFEFNLALIGKSLPIVIPRLRSQ